eukprot:2677307-Prymnesium_polylepis.1
MACIVPWSAPGAGGGKRNSETFNCDGAKCGHRSRAPTSGGVAIETRVDAGRRQETTSHYRRK